MRRHHEVFALAVLARVTAVVATTFTGMNPEADADAATFAHIAERAAGELGNGDLIVTSIWLIEPFWGTVLSPFWLLPGPSRLYARLVIALVGACAVYNVYVIARHFHSHRAGVVAALPMALFPSVLAVHSTILRDAAILFCLTSAVRLTVVPGLFDAEWKRYVAVVPLLSFATILRPENVWLFAVAVGVGMVTYALSYSNLSIPVIYAGLITFVLGALWRWSTISGELLHLADTRRHRALGRTKYLATVLPGTVPEIVAFSWIGAIYFLFTPFPWMVETPVDLLAAIEALVTLLFAVVAVFGVRRTARSHSAATAGLVAAFLVGSLLYGVGEANVGTAVRHRQQLVWILYLFGGVYVASRFEVDLDDRSPTSGSSTDGRPATDTGGS